ncbi:MAG: alanine--tRNA ligase [Gammaproteobacteria bacterium]|nr:MAG: alanine--tRNA ligase [Gammaproteobacteria bacterium]
MFSTAEVRQKFIDFFVARQHKQVQSSPLIPASDPTLLFTNAGMVPFKDVFTGDENRSYKTAVSVQKCLRAGGKHNDLENVGYTARHHTFFEMLGNFSFGDYFKEEAIKFAWDFLTVELNIPTEKLWVTVYHEDDEAADIWLNQIKINKNKLIKISTSDNFWQMGDTGPCGPCSEIFYDHGDKVQGGPPGSANEDGDRYIEIWNLVFMQFDKKADGTLEKLPNPCVDTGMGLERLVALLQGEHDNYDIDLFKNLLKDIASIIKVNDLKSQSLRVLADHIRSISFLIVDGILPGNEGRAYVLRRIIRRAARHGFKLGQKQEFIYKLLPALIEQMADSYPELKKQQQHIQKIIKTEESKFVATLSTGMALLQPYLKNNTTLDGEIIFKLYDTYGFPPDLTADICREKNMKIDMAGFDKHMGQQKKRAKSSAKFKTIEKINLADNTATDFIGYDALQENNLIVKQIIQNNNTIEILKTAEKALIILDKTPFYATAGGQIGDSGIMENDNCKLEVQITDKQSDVILHSVILKSGTLKTGDKITAVVDTTKREKTTINHSATHLLQSALREVLGDHIQQKGSQVNDKSLRFDFSHYEGLSDDAVNQVQDIVNQKIYQNIQSSTEVLSIDDAKKSGATALFDEKYGEKVRLVRFGDFSYEFCGGTHLKSTSQISLFVIISEQAIASGVRRIEATTSQVAFQYLIQHKKQIKDLTAILKIDSNNLTKKTEQLLQQNKDYKKELKQQSAKSDNNLTKDLIQNAVKIKDINFIGKNIKNIDRKSLQQTIDEIKNQLKNVVCVLATEEKNAAVVIAVCSDNLIQKISANDLLQHILPAINGKGGGRPMIAQGGGDNPKGIEKMLNSAKKYIETRGDFKND